MFMSVNIPARVNMVLMKRTTFECVQFAEMQVPDISFWLLGCGKKT